MYSETVKVENNINIYPNPIINEFLTVKFGMNKEIRYLIQLFDVAGNLIYSAKANESKDIDFSYFPKGLYILKITKGETTFNYKIIK